jgi:D-xylose transport system substrate-binding protein
VNAYPRGAAIAVAAGLLAVNLAACGKAGEVGKTGGNTSSNGKPKIGVLLPENHTVRYERFDRPLIEKKIRKLCGDCTVEYANAMQNAAAQQQQVDSMIINGVDVLILDPVNAKSIRSSVKKADKAGVPVVAYDRLAEGPVSGYVSFDGERVGRLQGMALLEALGDRAYGSQIVMMNGDTGDPDAALYKKGALSVLKGEVKIVKSYNTREWKPENAYANMSGAIANLGADTVDGVYAANDGLASGVISALKAARFSPLPPVTGQDASLAAVQNILSGAQYMSVYKPYGPEASAAAAMAVALAHGKGLGDIARTRVTSPTTKNVPAVLLTPISLTADNIKKTVVHDGMYTIGEICTPKYKSACEKAGLTE